MKAKEEIDWDALEQWLLGRPRARKKGALTRACCPGCKMRAIFHDDETGDHACLLCPWVAECHCL